MENNNNNDQIFLIKNSPGIANLNSSEDSNSDTGYLESVNDALLTDVNSEVNDTEEGSSKDAVNLRAYYVGAANFHNKNRPALDGKRSQPPIYERSYKEQLIVENTALLESSMERFNIAKEEFTTDLRKQCALFNNRALRKKATTYELETFDKHALVIFNQKEFNNGESRVGTEKDVESLTSTFTNFGFEVTLYNDLNKAALFEEVKKFSQRDFTDYGCVAVAILTHGSHKGRLRAKDKRYSEIKVINHFKQCCTPTLVSKPKIFIIQACRGSKALPGVVVLQSGKTHKDLEGEDSDPYYILPFECDMLILHSSYPGCVSHRDELHGTWFIQTLCKKIDTLSCTHDLESIISEVRREVAIDMGYVDCNLTTCKLQFNKQMPVVTSTLIRKLYLKRFGERTETYEDKSRQKVLDAVSNSPTTTGPCSCFLEHFTYMRNCLRHFVAENPNDETAQDILEAVNTYDDSDKFNKSKKKMCKVMSNHIMDKAQDSQISKYLHLFPVERKVTKSKNAQN